MNCKYLKIKRQNLNSIGGSSSVVENKCLYKMSSEEAKHEVYDALFEKGLESSFVNEDCPVAEIQKFSECPFFRKA